MKFGPLKENNMRNTFLEKSCTKCGGETSPRPSFKKSKLGISLGLPIKCQCCPHMETSQLICCANQLTGFYMRATLALNGPTPEVSYNLFSLYFLAQDYQKILKLRSQPFAFTSNKVFFRK